MKNKTIALTLLIVLFAMNFTSAIDCIPHSKKQTLEFSFSDTIANNCTVSTIDYPNGTISIYQLMTKTQNTYNATILGDNFTDFGIYTINIECDQGYGNICRDVTEYGTSTNSFMLYTLFYLVILLLSYILVYKFATYNGKDTKDNSFYFWAGFLDLILFVVIQVNGFGGADTLVVQVIKMICFGSGAYFLIQGIFSAVDWGKKKR